MPVCHRSCFNINEPLLIAATPLSPAGHSNVGKRVLGDGSTASLRVWDGMRASEGLVPRPDHDHQRAAAAQYRADNVASINRDFAGVPGPDQC